MTQYIKSWEKSVSANAVEELVGEILTPKGFKITVHEVWFKMAGVGIIYGFLENERIITLHQEVLRPKEEPAVIKIVLKEGQKLKFVATDESGATNLTHVAILYTKETA